MTPTPPLPQSIWVLAWVSLVGQVITVLGRGLGQPNAISYLLSMALGIALLTFVSAGVVRARGFRVGLAWVVLVLSTGFGLLAVVNGGSTVDVLTALLAVAINGVSLVALHRFSQSDWYAWQKTRPPATEGASIRGLLVIAAVVGALGGVTGAATETGTGFSFRLGGESVEDVG